jgi:hypothetical protein
MAVGGSPTGVGPGAGDGVALGGGPEDEIGEVSAYPRGLGAGEG